MSALNKQVGGDHYKKMNYQPLSFSMDVGASPAFAKVVKYVTREKNKRTENLHKAFHCVELEQEWCKVNNLRAFLPGAKEVFLEVQFYFDNFCNQFGDFRDKYFETFFFMYIGAYEEAKECIEDLIEWEMQNG